MQSFKPLPDQNSTLPIKQDTFLHVFQGNNFSISKWPHTNLIVYRGLRQKRMLSFQILNTMQLVQMYNKFTPFDFLPSNEDMSSPKPISPLSCWNLSRNIEISSFTEQQVTNQGKIKVIPWSKIMLPQGTNLRPIFKNNYVIYENHSFILNYEK